MKGVTWAGKGTQGETAAPVFSAFEYSPQSSHTGLGSRNTLWSNMRAGQWDVEDREGNKAYHI